MYQILRAQAKTPFGAVRLSDEEVVWVTAELIIGGSETTATTLALAIFLLAAHPRAEARLAREIEHGVAQGGLPKSAKDLQRFPYAEMVSARLAVVALPHCILHCNLCRMYG